MRRRIGLSSAVVYVLTGVVSTMPAFAQAQETQPVQRVLVGEGVDSLSRLVESPDGRFLAVEGPRSIGIWDLRTSRLIKLGYAGQFMRWNRAGDRLVFQRPHAAGVTHIWTVPIDTVTGRAAGAPRRVSLAPGSGASFSPDGREIAYVRAPTGGGRELLVIPAAGGPARVVARFERSAGFTHWSPDGEWIYFGHATQAGAAAPGRVRASGGDVEVLGTGVFRGLSADGRFIAYLPYGQVLDAPAPLVVATADGREIARARLPVYSYLPSWSGNGYRILFTQLDIPMRLHAIDVETGAVSPLVTGATHDRLPAFSPDGRRLAVQRRIDGAYRLALLDTSGRLLRQYDTGDLSSHHFWSPDGRRIAYESGVPRRIRVLDLDTGRELDLGPEPAARTLTPLQWSGSGRALLRAEWDEAARTTIIVEYRLDASRREVARSPAAEPWSALAFMGDTAAVVWAGTALSVLDLRTGAQRAVFAGSGDAGMRLAPSPDGRSIAIVQPASPAQRERARVTLIGLDGGAARPLPFTSGCGSGMQWHPGMRHIVVDAWDRCDARLEVHMVPVDGSAPRRLTAGMAGLDFDNPAISPDGRTIVIAAETAQHNRFVEIDFAPLLRHRRDR